MTITPALQVELYAWTAAVENSRREYAKFPLAHCARALCTDLGRPKWCSHHKPSKKDRP